MARLHMGVAVQAESGEAFTLDLPGGLDPGADSGGRLVRAHSLTESIKSINAS
jgi:hypothetical protein